jgi:hypothetical protein
MNLRELMIEYILFAFTEEQLMQFYQVTEEELPELADQDLLEIYDQTLLSDVVYTGQNE